MRDGGLEMQGKCVWIGVLRVDKTLPEEREDWNA